MLPTIDKARLRALQKTLGVRFRNKSLIVQALIHKSWAVENRGVLFNERLEFLGDSVLALCTAEFLYVTNPDDDEGGLSKVKSVLVSKNQLAQWARDIDLGSYIMISAAEAATGGSNKNSILANVFEAVLGAMFLDRGIRTCKTFLETKFLKKGSRISFTDYKSVLQEYVQKKHKVLPSYEIQNEIGPDHEKLFEVQVKIKGKPIGKGTGRTKKLAEQAAAKATLEQLQAPID
jgi:ribonuclease-3